MTVTWSLVDGILLLDVQHLLDGLDDEYDGDQGGKVLLSKPRYVADRKAGVRGD